MSSVARPGLRPKTHWVVAMTQFPHTSIRPPRSSSSPHPRRHQLQTSAGIQDRLLIMTKNLTWTSYRTIPSLTMLLLVSGDLMTSRRCLYQQACTPPWIPAAFLPVSLAGPSTPAPPPRSTVGPVLPRVLRDDLMTRAGSSFSQLTVPIADETCQGM